MRLYWCRKGREGQRNLTLSSFKFLKDENNRPFANMTHDEQTKNHPGGVGDVESFEKEGRLYQTTDDPSDGFSALQFYISKLNPECTAFPVPKAEVVSCDSIWYENRPLGIQKLGTMIKEMSDAAGLSKNYTNHSVKATAITLWSNAGLSNRHIMAIRPPKRAVFEELQRLSFFSATTTQQRCVVERIWRDFSPI